jgi:chemotaxis family two-component system response regulator Rcp1
MAAKARKARGPKPLSILLVDDDAGDCRLVAESLKDSPRSSSLHTVNSGDAALEYLRRSARARNGRRPDLVLLDLNMPGKDGFATLREIRAEEALSDLPVIILTTSTDSRDVLESYRLHANCFVSKPSGFEDFGAAVREIEAFWGETATLPSP